MDTSDPEITFDELGNCNHCNEFYDDLSKLVYQGQSSDTKLKAIVDKIKRTGKNNEFDCVIGISGGIDSCYVAYIVKQLGLRPLAVHLDNGWDSEQAVKNIKYVCKKLDIDYQSFVLDWEEFRDIQLSVLKSSIVEVEIPTDVAILGALHKVAADNKVKFIISGSNYATEGILPDKWFYNPKDLRLLKGIHKRFGTKKMRTFPDFDYKKEIYYKFIKGIRMVYILNYVPYSKEKTMKILEDELGWKYYGGKHYESKFTGFVQSYIQPVKFNLDYRRATLSTQICTGEVKREDAMTELQKEPYNAETLGAEKEYVSKKFGLTVEEFEDIMNAEPKSYRDYPNDERLTSFIYRVYRILFSNKA